MPRRSSGSVDAGTANADNNTDDTNVGVVVPTEIIPTVAGEILPSKSNINYLKQSLRPMYDFSEQETVHLVKILNEINYLHNGWAMWFATIYAKLGCHYKFGYLIHEDPEFRETTPIRFTNESEDDFDSRLSIFNKRSELVFMAIAGHILSTIPQKGYEGNSSINMELNNAHTLCQQQMAKKDPILLLNLLRQQNKGADIYDISNLLEKFGTLKMRDDDDAGYINRAKQLFSDMEAAGIEINIRSKMSKVVAGLSSKEHQFLKRTLVSNGADSLKSLTLDELLQKMLASSDTNRSTDQANMASANLDWGNTGDWPPSKKPLIHKKAFNNDRAPAILENQTRRFNNESKGRERQRSKNFKRVVPKGHFKGSSSYDQDKSFSSKRDGGHQQVERTPPVCRFCLERGHLITNCPSLEVVIKNEQKSRLQKMSKNLGVDNSDPTGITPEE